LFVAADGVPDLNFSDRDGELRLNLGVSRNGVPDLGLLDKDERSGLILSLTPDGSFLMDFDRAGKSLLALAVTSEGASSLQFLDAAPDDGEDAVKDLPQVHRAGSPAGLGRGEHPLEPLPLSAGQIGGVAFGFGRGLPGFHAEF
jgi:hypothetical protein